MVVKVYISGISGNKEVKKRQQRVLLILDSKNVKYDVIDIAEPENEEQKDFMQNNSTSAGGTISDPTPRHPLPPQLFNDDTYCGDYDQFDMANEIDEMEEFLKIAPSTKEKTVISNAEIKLGNGEIHNETETKDEIDNGNEAKAEENGDEKIEEKKSNENEADNEQNEEPEEQDN